MTENNEYKSIFISGNNDLSEKQFIQYYLPIITELIKDDNIYFCYYNHCCFMRNYLSLFIQR